MAYLSHVSENWHRIGYTPDKAKGMKAWDFADKNTEGWVKDAIDESLAGESVFLRRMVTRHGEEFEGRFESFAVPKKAQRMVAVVSRRIRPRELLTDRELDVLLAVCEDLSNAGVAKRLGVTVSLVEKYRSSLKQKLGVNGDAGMVLWAMRHGLL